MTFLFDTYKKLSQLISIFLQEPLVIDNLNIDFINIDVFKNEARATIIIVIKVN